MMSGEIVVALKMATDKQWIEVFDEMIRNKESQIIGTPDEELPKLKSQILQIAEVKNLFLVNRNR